MTQVFCHSLLLQNTMFTFSIVVMYMYMGVPYFVHEGGSACFTDYWGGFSPLYSLPTSVYVTYLRPFVVVSKSKMFTCSYLQCVCNKCVYIGTQKYTLQCLFPLGHAPFTYGNSSICCGLQDAMFNSIMGIWV